MSAEDPAPPRKPRRRANALDGASWTRNSISVWSDLRKTPAEAALGHPALFPMALVSRLIDCFTPEGPALVVDPFAGTGSTPLAACFAGKRGVGVELSAEYVRVARERFRRLVEEEPDRSWGVFEMVEGSAETLPALVAADSVDLCVTSPPYWDILKQRRSADGREVRHYGDEAADLGAISDYSAFLDALEPVFEGVLEVLKPGGYCCVVVMDLRKGNRFYPFHSDLWARLERCGFLGDDLVIWDRRQEYNYLRPLGYPSVFRINKVHEFVLIFRKAMRDTG